MKDQTVIVLERTPTADSRSCDCSKISERELLRSSKSHMRDVRRTGDLLCRRFAKALEIHDHDKVSDICAFHKEFVTDFGTRDWLDNHFKVNRHHLSESGGVPEDVDLIDVLEHITDCVAAGTARTGVVYPVKLPDDLLQKAVENTVKFLTDRVRVVS